MFRFPTSPFALPATLALALAALGPCATARGDEAPRHPALVAGENAFFAAFTGGAGDPAARDTARVPLLAAHLSQPGDARATLLLGLQHLWASAEGDRQDPRTFERLVLADRYLARARALDPGDARIVTWHAPVRFTLAQIERDPRAAQAAIDELAAAFAADPGLHGFPLALLSFGRPAGSPEFARGLAALEAALAVCRDSSAAGCGNAPHWPHSREGFLAFHADYALKAGQPERARALLADLAAGPDYPRWHLRARAEERRANLDRDAALFANADPADDPPPVMTAGGAVACQGCHRGP